jgi:catechol 2,3-dioxygenase-like lactoylglutathione lyase family enzyme
MESRIDIITLAVADLERALAFYRDGLGLESRGVIGTEFVGEAAGATLTDQPHDRPWGIYSGYFRDPDGHLWEVLWNPRLLRAHE